MTESEIAVTTTSLPVSKDAPAASDWIRVATLADLRTKGVIVVRGEDRPIAVYAHDGKVSAVDNRCPHLGFPLHRGSVQDGILTCHWHHARFDLCSGCTFDLFADDVPAYDVEIRGDEVFVAALPRPHDPVEHHTRRLREGLEQNIALIQAKAIIGLLKAGVDYRAIVREIALFGTKLRDGWGNGMTILTTMANVVPHVSEETAYLALCQGARRVAGDTEGATPRRARHPLDAKEIPIDTLDRWMRQWTTVRHRDGAERTLLTAIRNGASKSELSRLIFGAATERFYADTGHVLDFCDKAFEVLDLIGWEHAEQVLPSVVRQLVGARGGEESNAWRHPVDLVPVLRQIEAELPALIKQSAGKTWNGERALAQAVLGDDPLANLSAVRGAVAAGATPEQLARSVAYAGALRLARFGTSNEFGDWITALHTFTYCNALHQAIRRCDASVAAGLVRGVLHGAVSIYLDRFLNVPPAKLPGERDSLEGEPREADVLLKGFLASLDRSAGVQDAARLIARCLQLGHPAPALFDALTLACVREDAEFHTFQVVEAGIRQYEAWGAGEEGTNILIAVARYLAAHSPTQRAQLQTSRVALRLHRGESLHEDAQ